VGDLGEDGKAGADIFAAFGVVGAGGEHCPGPSLGAVHGSLVEVGGRKGPCGGVAADLVEGGEAVVSVEGGVFDALGGGWGGELLETDGDLALLFIIR
ncbi:MAG: hypothetical protein WD114_01985, partial [Phycisphaerales bacterium]